LIAVLMVLFAWSLSDRIYIGDRLILSYEMPQFLADTLLSWFRSCGRFFWPLAWPALACGTAGIVALAKRGPMLGFLLTALFIQWIDVAPWRSRFAGLIAEPETSVLGSLENANNVENLMRKTGSVLLVPSIWCSSAAGDYASPLNAAAMEIQMMAARAHARMQHPYLSRTVQRCDEPDGLVGPRVVVLLQDPGREMRLPAATTCNRYGETFVCLQGQ
jgi:hypothetical protein